MINAILIEDSRLARQELKELLKSFPQVQIAGEAGTASQALELIKLVNPDLIFLDIHLPGKSGFDILQELDSVPAVIFTTAFDQYALQSFDYNAIDYLLKPIVPERLEHAIQKAEILLKETTAAVRREKLTVNDRIFVKDGSKCWFITIGDIRLFESKGNYTQIFFDGNSPLILKSLQHIDETLDDQQFVRVNRQQIVNVKFIANVNEWFGGGLKLTLDTGETIEVSRRQVSRIRELFSL
jgi:two-component system LytT family response regulator